MVFLDDLATVNNLTVTLDLYNQVQFDSVDIEVLRVMVNLGRALFIFLQAIDLNITDYMVEYNGSSVDIRYLITHPDMHIDDDELEEEEMESVADQLFMNHSNLFTYLDRSRLSDFRLALESAGDHYSNAVTVIATMTPQERRDRYTHAFNLDTDYGVAWATLMRDEVVPSVMSCIDNPSGEIILPWDEETGYGYVDGGDGFSYFTIYYDIYYDRYCFDSVNYTISIYDILNIFATDSPRDVLVELRELQQNLPPDAELIYDVYVPCLQAVLYR
ncbi:MAG TPA: hypothetical protein PKJ15_08360, partial [Methanomassiliicoccales archaeon]|nr:hypothetical protein [Methanomassiliicoccales archaeon]